MLSKKKDNHESIGKKKKETKQSLYNKGSIITSSFLMSSFSTGRVKGVSLGGIQKRKPRRHLIERGKTQEEKKGKIGK